MKKTILAISLVSANLLLASNFDQKWKEKEMIASDTETPAELLIDIKNNSKNPFVLEALNNNPKFIKLQENENKIKILESRKVFETNLDEITNHFDLINENLKKILYVYKINTSKELMIKKELESKFKDMKDDFKKKYTIELDKINVKFKSELMKINSDIYKLNKKLEDRKNKFNQQLVDYIRIEQKKMVFSTEDINKKTKMMRNNIKSIVNYLKNIEDTIFDIIQNVKFKELKDTINPELLTIQSLYKVQIKKISNNIDKIFNKKNKLLYLLEARTIEKSKKVRELKIMKMNKELTIIKINKTAELKKKIIDLETKREISKLEADYQKKSNILEIAINQLNLKINEILFVYKEISKEDKITSQQINQFKKLVNTLKISKALVIKKDFQVDKEQRSFTNSVERKIKIAKSINAPIRVLIKYSRNLDWRVREAVAKNPNTPLEILKDLSVDNNLFVQGAAKTTISYQNKRKEAAIILKKNY